MTVRRYSSSGQTAVQPYYRTYTKTNTKTNNGTYTNNGTRRRRAERYTETPAKEARKGSFRKTKGQSV